jgi:hypothetical protein
MHVHPIRWHVVRVQADEVAATLERLEKDLGPASMVKLVPQSAEKILIAFRGAALPTMPQPEE